MRLALLVVLGLLAGCISVPDDPDAPPSTPGGEAPEHRIEGMTASETKEDAVVDCGGGSLQLPPGVCAERVLTVEGQIGVPRLPVDLSTVNGAVTLVPSVGDAWSFVARIRVRGLTEDIARKGLDTAWSWDHEGGGVHRLRAGPVVEPSVEAPGATLESASYEITLPRWVVLDVGVKTTNGAVVVDGFAAEGIRVETTNGGVTLSGSATNVAATTTNGGIDARVLTGASGKISLSTTNGHVALLLREDAARGYDLKAETTNGGIEIMLADGDVATDESLGRDASATFKTEGYASREIQTQVDLATTNGGIEVLPGA